LAIKKDRQREEKYKRCDAYNTDKRSNCLTDDDIYNRQSERKENRCSLRCRVKAMWMDFARGPGNIKKQGIFVDAE